MSSAVRSPSASEYSFLQKLIRAWSISSPATRIDSLATIPPSEMTATSVVPPPMSTTMLPEGSVIGSPAPIPPALRSPMGYNPPAGAGGERARAPGALLHLGDAEGDADDDARPDQRLAVVRLLDEVAQHRLGD